VAEFLLKVLLAVATGVVGVTFLLLQHAAIRVVLDLREEFGAIIESVHYYSNLYHNPGVGKPEAIEQGSSTMRRHASRLQSLGYRLPFYGIWHALRLVPSRADMEECRRSLVGLSNSFGAIPDNLQMRHYDAVKSFSDTIYRVAGFLGFQHRTA